MSWDYCLCHLRGVLWSQLCPHRLKSFVYQKSACQGLAELKREAPSAQLHLHRSPTSTCQWMGICTITLAQGTVVSAIMGEGGPWCLPQCLLRTAGKGEEQSLAATVLTLLCLQMGSGPEGEEVFRSLKPLLINILTDTSASPISRQSVSIELLFPLCHGPLGIRA